MLLENLGPYETQPRLAVAVSGGPDSLALALLADRWARTRQAAILALTVDHGLRPESRAEAITVGRWLGFRGIPHQILSWTGDKPSTGIQAAARAARYDLLTERCRREGILHLLLGHHRDDQAETVALRRARQSGPDGLAGMAPVRELAGVRLLRPLLQVPKARMVGTLHAEGQPWLEDPSNRAPRFARSRLRGRRRPRHGLDAAGLAATARSFARARAELDRAVAAWLVAHARVDPAGYALISRTALQHTSTEIARRAVQQALATVGGNLYPPRQERFRRLLEALLGSSAFAGRTLAGCRIVCRGNGVLICREPAAIRETLRLEAGVSQTWDRRFAVRLIGQASGLILTALGEEGWRERRCLKSVQEDGNVPPPVGPGLPAVRQGERLVMVPHLGLRGPDLSAGVQLEVRFRPARPLAGPVFACS